MRCHSASNSKYTLRSLHSRNILGRCLKTYKNNLFTCIVPLLCVLSRKYNLTAGSSGRCSKAFSYRRSCLNCLGVKLRMKQCVEVSRIYHKHGFLLCSHALVNEVACYLKSRLSRSLSVSRLEHEELSMFNGELHVLHVSVMIFECSANLIELRKCLRELLLHFGYLHRCTYSGNNVLALSIRKEFSEETFVSRSRITCKRNTCSAIVTHVSESHHLYVYSRSP